MGKRILLGATTLVLLLGALVGPAAAATRASIISDGLRVDVTFTGKKPTKARLIAGGASYTLKRNGKTWRTKPLTPAQLTSIVGTRAKVKITVGGKQRTVRAMVTGNAGTPTNPTTPTNPGTPPLFTAPGTDSTGNAAWEAVKGYFANSTLTDCPAGWPNCAVEQRYGYFENGTTWYCRLTSTSGSDIRSQATITEILGAEQKADGSWAVSYRDEAYGYPHTYTVRVAANGAGTVQYWASGVDPNTNAPTEVYTGLQWMRGAKDCSY
ncbi:MAG: hypothetical protein V9E82_04510 [Candidatus Nanopelagicales bacterium]